MKTPVVVILFTFFTIVISSCKKDDGNEHLITVSSLSFGKAAFAAETTLKYYKLTPYEIYQDSTVGPNGQIFFSSVPLNHEKQLIARHLLERLPGYLIEHPNQTFGCPNCEDQGLVYIETTIQGVPMKWYIDPTSFPSQLSSFVADLNTTMEAL